MIRAELTMSDEHSMLLCNHNDREHNSRWISLQSVHSLSPLDNVILSLRMYRHCCCSLHKSQLFSSMPFTLLNLLVTTMSREIVCLPDFQFRKCASPSSEMTFQLPKLLLYFSLPPQVVSSLSPYSPLALLGALPPL